MNQNKPITLFVRYFNGTAQEFQTMVNKLNPDIAILNIIPDSKYSYKVTVANATQGRFLINFNGVNWNGQKVIVDFIEEPVKDEQFKFVLESIKHRYCDIMNRSLDLSNLKEKLRQHNFNPNKNQDVVFREALQYFYNAIPDLLHLNISHNEIAIPFFFDEMKNGFKELVSLDISFNQMTTFLPFNHLKGLSLRNINAIQNQLPNEFPIEMLDSFPYLQTYNGQNIRQAFFSSTVQTTVKPLKYNTMQPFNEMKFGQIYDFLKVYFTLFDNNRNELARFYNNVSLFDITLRDNILLPNIHSRTTTIDDMDHVANNLYVGSQNIIQYMNQLGQTQHRLSEICFDVLDYSGICIITLHGQCIINQRIFQFCRTFIINENPFVILNDHLQLYDGSRGFMVIKTFAPYVKYMTQRFPGLSEKDGLFLLEKHRYNIASATEEVAIHFNHVPASEEKLNPKDALGGDITQEEINKINPMAIETLISVGLRKEQAIRALILCGGNIEAAADIAIQMKNGERLDQVATITSKNEEILSHWDLFDDQKIQQMVEATGAHPELCKQLYLKYERNIELAVNEFFNSYM